MSYDRYQHLGCCRGVGGWGFSLIFILNSPFDQLVKSVDPVVSKNNRKLFKEFVDTHFPLRVYVRNISLDLMLRTSLEWGALGLRSMEVTHLPIFGVDVVPVVKLQSQGHTKRTAVFTMTRIMIFFLHGITNQSHQQWFECGPVVRLQDFHLQGHGYESHQANH